ncbi:helix-turn-helix transcriptional regulator [Actinotalea solisilvae]|uniref:helix-turn-helix transcriptional regulator n=1 Tax=Actinotalea solisilvae TaxID=2072922 RepID=UPI0018F1DAF0|nr:GAF domain-containing protein [Actinotalea solisilvae]
MVDGDREPGRRPRSRARAPRLERAVADLYADLRLTPTLHTLLAESRRLVDAPAGSISVVDRESSTYRKLAERGIACRLGQSFPLDEGATGQAVARRRPVVIDDYASVSGGHLPPDHPASHGAALAVPIWWRGDVIGVNVAFAGRRRRFTPDDVDALEVLTQSAAGAIVTAGRGEPSLARVLRDHARTDGDPPGGRRVVTEVGDVRPVSRAVADAAVGLVAEVDRAVRRGGTAPRLHVALVHRPDTLRLLVQQEAEPGRDRDGSPGTASRAWHELRAALDGAADVAEIPGWGTLLRADIPYASAAAERPARAGTAASGLTPREAEVLGWLAHGLGDREIAERLVVSRRTVEKHVGAVLRKTGTSSRTAAVVHALDHGWLPRA